MQDQEMHVGSVNDVLSVRLMKKLKYLPAKKKLK